MEFFTPPLTGALELANAVNILYPRRGAACCRSTEPDSGGTDRFLIRQFLVERYGLRSLPGR
jgi:hypothetical protein